MTNTMNRILYALTAVIILTQLYSCNDFTDSTWQLQNRSSKVLYYKFKLLSSLETISDSIQPGTTRFLTNTGEKGLRVNRFSPKQIFASVKINSENGEYVSKDFLNTNNWVGEIAEVSGVTTTLFHDYIFTIENEDISALHSGLK